MGDLDCNCDLDCGDCDCDCDCTDCGDGSGCCDNCFPSGEDTIILCINLSQFTKNNNNNNNNNIQVNDGCWWCCWPYNTTIPRQRRTTQTTWRVEDGRKPNRGDIEGSSRKQASICCCNGSRMPKDDKCTQCPYPYCQECSSSSSARPSFDPPISQRFETLYREKYVGEGKHVIPHHHDVYK